MASLSDTIPIELLRGDRKFQVVEFIRGLKLPSRFARKLLQDWAEAVFIDLNSTDYEFLERK